MHLKSRISRPVLQCGRRRCCLCRSVQGQRIALRTRPDTIDYDARRFLIEHVAIYYYIHKIYSMYSTRVARRLLSSSHDQYTLRICHVKLRYTFWEGLLRLMLPPPIRDVSFRSHGSTIQPLHCIGFYYSAPTLIRDPTTSSLTHGRSFVEKDTYWFLYILSRVETRVLAL